MMDDEELERIKQQKLRELQMRLLQQQMEEQAKLEELARAEAERKRILRVILEPEARQRLARLRLVRPEYARFIEDQLILLAQSGRLRKPITDDQLVKILESLYRQRKEFRIRRL